MAWGPPAPVRIGIGIAFLFAYGFYLRLTLRGGGEVQEEESLNPLIFERRPEHREDPALALCLIQLVVGLGAMVGGAHLFVEELLTIADSVGVEALVLALILAPLATELPEKVNSFFWVREGKDALALGNITGAMVFQSTIPVGIGLLFTDWELSGNAILSICLGLAGGLLAFESLHVARRFKLPAVVGWFALYTTFIVIVAAGARARRQSSASAFRTSASCFFGWTLGKTLAILPSASMMNVVRRIPMYFFPYIDFSPQAP
jgi:cation:H+ antiporter